MWFGSVLQVKTLTCGSCLTSGTVRLFGILLKAWLDYLSEKLEGEDCICQSFPHNQLDLAQGLEEVSIIYCFKSLALPATGLLYIKKKVSICYSLVITLQFTGNSDSQRTWWGNNTSSSRESEADKEQLFFNCSRWSLRREEQLHIPLGPGIYCLLLSSVIQLTASFHCPGHLLSYISRPLTRSLFPFLAMCMFVLSTSLASFFFGHD